MPEEKRTDMNTNFSLTTDELLSKLERGHVFWEPNGDLKQVVAQWIIGQDPHSVASLIVFLISKLQIEESLNNAKLDNIFKGERDE